MQPIAPLMIEHRLIERMVHLMRQDLERIRANILVDPEFAFVDPVFILSGPTPTAATMARKRISSLPNWTKSRCPPT
jgi:hypothetical protein